MDRSTQFDARPTFRSFSASRSGAAVCLAVVAVVLGSFACGGCSSSRPPQAPMDIDDIYENRLSYRDSLIMLTGTFMGWQGDQCVFPPYAARQANRSDWIFKVGDRCLYVTGGRPPDLSPADDGSVGAKISLEARLKITSDDRLLLEYVRSAPVSQ